MRKRNRLKPTGNNAYNFYRSTFSLLFILRYTILHSHGNAVDLGAISSFYMGLGTEDTYLLFCQL